jgi:hypothetical protein
MTDRLETFQHRRDIEWFWLFVQQNPGLVRIQLPTYATINDLSKRYILDTLAAMKNLKEVDLIWLDIDPSTLLDVPKLKRLRITSPRGHFTLSRPFFNLRQFHYKNSVFVSRFLQVLKYLHNLENFSLQRIMPEESASTHTSLCNTVSSATTATTTTITSGALFPQMREFRVD